MSASEDKSGHALGPAECRLVTPTATSAVPIEGASLSRHDAMALEGLRRIAPTSRQVK
jgi:hypothetical protein